MIRAIPLSFFTKETDASFRTYFCAFCRNGSLKLWRKGDNATNQNQVLACLRCLAGNRQITLRAAWSIMGTTRPEELDFVRCLLRVAPAIPSHVDENGRICRFWEASNVPPVALKWWQALPIRVPS